MVFLVSVIPHVLLSLCAKKKVMKMIREFSFLLYNAVNHVNAWIIKLQCFFFRAQADSKITSGVTEAPRDHFIRLETCRQAAVPRFHHKVEIKDQTKMPHKLKTPLKCHEVN